MKTFGTFVGVLFGLALLTIFLTAIYYLYEYVLSLFGSFEPQLKNIMIVVAIVAIFCAVIIASGLRASSSNNVSSERINLYQRLLVLWSERLRQTDEVAEIEKADGSTGLEQQLALHGSPKVITAYMNLRRAISQEGKIADDAIELLKKMLVEMRSDIGHTELNIKKIDLVDLLMGRH